MESWSCRFLCWAPACPQIGSVNYLSSINYSSFPFEELSRFNKVISGKSFKDPSKTNQRTWGVVGKPSRSLWRRAVSLFQSRHISVSHYFRHSATETFIARRYQTRWNRVKATPGELDDSALKACLTLWPFQGWSHYLQVFRIRLLAIVVISQDKYLQKTHYQNLCGA